MKNLKFLTAIIIIIFITFYSPKVFAIPPAPPPPPPPPPPVSNPIEPPDPEPGPEEKPEPRPPDEQREPPPTPVPPTPTPTPCIPAPCYYMVTECCFNVGCLFLGNSTNTVCKLGNVEKGLKSQSVSPKKSLQTQSQNKPFFIKMIEFLKVIF